MYSSPHTGRVGFYNEGNSCFVNATVQCLIHLPELQRFLLYEKYNNKAISTTSITYNLATVLEKMFQTKESAVSIASVVSALKSVASYLFDGLQHDSHELMSFLLQGLEDETKRNLKSETPIINTYAGDVASNTRNINQWWNQYLRLNNSEVTSLFYGYTISSNFCDACSESSLSLSSFNTLYVSLPLQQTSLTVNLIVQNLNTEQEFMLLEIHPIHIKVDFDASFKDVQTAINSYLAPSSTACILLLGSYNMASRQITYSTVNETDHINKFAKNSSIHFILFSYVVPKQLISHPYVIINGIEFDNEIDCQPNYIILPLLLFYSSSLSSQHSIAIRIKSIIHCMLKHNSGTLQDSTPLCSIHLSSRKIPSVTIKEDYLTQNGFFNEHYVASQNPIISTFLIYSEDNDVFPKDLTKIEWNQHHIPKALFIDWSTALTIEEYAESLRSYDLSIRPLNLRKCVPTGVTLSDAISVDLVQKNDDIVLTCPSCQQTMRFNPTIKYGATPSILIIQLKRFDFSIVKVTVKRNGQLITEKRYQRRKITDVIEFPLNNLDLSEFQIEEKHLYDCVCVCNHWGTDDYGHYYAYCRDFYDHNWYEYNDERVRQIKEENVITGNAYILFYRRKDLDETVSENVLRAVLAHQIESNEMLEHEPSKWLLNEEDETMDEDESISPKKTFKHSDQNRFNNYSAAVSVGGVTTEDFVHDIQGYKTVTSKDVTKRSRMKDFQSMYLSSLRRKESTDIKPPLQERTSLCTGEVLPSSYVSEYEQSSCQESCCEHYQTALFYAIAFSILMITIIWLLIKK